MPLAEQTGVCVTLTVARRVRCGIVWNMLDRCAAVARNYAIYLRGAVSSVWAVRKPCAALQRTGEARLPAGRPPAAAAHGREEDRGKLLGFRRVWFLTSGGTIKL